MPQTLSIFLAMLVLVTFSVSQQRAIITTYGQTYEREVTMAATDFTLQRFTEMRGKKFDAGIGAGAMGTVKTANLTVTPGQEGGTSDFNDIDDYANSSGEQVTHELGDQTYEFLVVTKVTYVDPDTGIESSTPQQGKKVTLEVYKNEAAKDAGRFYVRLSRTYTLNGITV